MFLSSIKSFFSLLSAMLLVASAAFLQSCHEKCIEPVQAEQFPTTSQRVKRITWADTDFQEYQYDSNGLLSKYISQWLFVQGTDQVKRVETDFQYDTGKKLVRTVTGNLYETKFFYRGNVLEKSEEYDHLGRLAVTHYYTFNHRNQPLQIRDVITDPTDGNKLTGELKHVFKYDNRGNNTVQEEYIMNLTTGAYEYSYGLHFEGFDNNRYVEHAVALNPYVPQAKRWINNYTSRTLRDKTGKVLQPSQKYTFHCNEEGYPLRKTMEHGGVSINATITYEAIQ
jgi:hypothetical protein